MAATAPKDQSFFPLANSTQDGFSNDEQASATCYCGAVQLSVPLKAPGMMGANACRCTDCRKLMSAFGATNFAAKDDAWRYVRGEDKITQFKQTVTIPDAETMTNHFCSTCGTLMRRVGSRFPGLSFLPTGTVDDFTLHETVFKPAKEIYVKDRASWCVAVDGAEQVQAM